MHRLLRVATIVMMVAACTGTRSSAAAPEASNAPASILATAAASPTAPATASPAATVVATSAASETACGSAMPLAVEELGRAIEAGCLAGRDVEARGYLDAPPGIGFGPTWIEPRWLYFPVFEAALWTSPPGADQDCGGIELCNAVFVFVDPESGADFGLPARWVIVTGHTNDPASATCHYASDPPRTFTDEENAEARRACAERFVVTAVRDAP